MCKSFLYHHDVRSGIGEVGFSLVVLAKSCLLNINRLRDLISFQKITAFGCRDK